jgi:hypothetical protein
MNENMLNQLEPTNFLQSGNEHSSVLSNRNSGEVNDMMMNNIMQYNTMSSNRGFDSYIS